jgi:hypothetical protein
MNALRHVFSYRGMQSRWVTLAWVAFFEGLAAFAGLAVFQQEGLTSRLILIPLGGAVFFAVLGIVALLGTSDVIVDDSGVAWALLGRVWREIHWEDVQEIRMYSVPMYFARRPTSAIAIYPKGRSRVGPGGGSFDDRIEGSAALRRLLHGYVSLHGIPVRAWKDGVLAPSNILSA